MAPYPEILNRLSKQISTSFFLLFPLWIFAQHPSLEDSSDINAFFDGVIETYMQEKHVAGVTVSLVRNGRLWFAKGYGYADLEEKRPVDPETSLFRIGSISKAFVWTAIMQLYQQDKLELDADVNFYLTDFEIPEAYGHPITLKDIMTHSTGFEEHIIGLFARDSSSLRPLGEILRAELPTRVRPAGEVSSYSNHATGIAAYIVEQVSGMSFEEYVEQHILQPLNMRHTTFRQPFPDSLAKLLSKGYTWQAGSYQEESFEYVPLGPVGAAGATATDMARFMRMHLQLGQLDTVSVMDSTTAQQMQTVIYRHHPDINGIAYGLYEMSRNGRFAIGHGGDTFWFHSLMALLPEEGVGLFISTNSQGGGGMPNEVYEAFMDRYFPAPLESEAARVDFSAAGLKRFTGVYRSNRYAHDDMTKISALMGSFEVTQTDEGLLRTAAREPMRWVQTGPLTFREKDGNRKLAFREGGKGKISYLFFDDVPILSYEKVPWWETPKFTAGLMVSSLLLLLLAFLFWPVGALQRWRYGVKQPTVPLLPLLAKGAAWLTAFLVVLFLITTAAKMQDPMEIAFGLPEGIAFENWFLWGGALSGLLSLGCMVWIWVAKKGSLFARLFYSLLVLGFVAIYWFLLHWNLLALPWR